MALERGRLAVAVDGLPPKSFSGVGFRHQAAQWQFSQPGAGARTVGGRWNPPASFATVYLGGSTAVAAAELRRLANSQGRHLQDFLPRHLLEYRVELANLLDLTSPRSQSTLDLADRWDTSYCQAIGETAHHLGREGVLAPSAAGPGHVVAVFTERLQPGSWLELVSTTEWVTVSDELRDET